MEKEFATLPNPVQRLLGPLWLLWHGGWRTALRCYLPLVLADACSRGLVGFGMAHHNGFLPGCRFCLQYVRQFSLAAARSAPDPPLGSTAGLAGRHRSAALRRHGTGRPFLVFK